MQAAAVKASLNLGSEEGEYAVKAPSSRALSDGQDMIDWFAAIAFSFYIRVWSWIAVSAMDMPNVILLHILIHP